MRIPNYAEIMEVRRDVQECQRAIEAIVPLALAALQKHGDEGACLQIADALKGTPWEVVRDGGAS